MSKMYGPSPKGVWSIQRSPARLSKRAKSSNHSKLRMKGKSKYPGGSCLVSPSPQPGHDRPG